MWSNIMDLKQLKLGSKITNVTKPLFSKFTLALYKCNHVL